LVYFDLFKIYLSAARVELSICFSGWRFLLLILEKKHMFVFLRVKLSRVVVNYI